MIWYGFRPGMVINLPSTWRGSDEIERIGRYR